MISIGECRCTDRLVRKTITSCDSYCSTRNLAHLQSQSHWCHVVLAKFTSGICTKLTFHLGFFTRYLLFLMTSEIYRQYNSNLKLTFLFSVTNLITLQLVILSAKAVTLEQKINQSPDEFNVQTKMRSY